MAEEQVERFAQSGGTLTGVAGLVVATVCIAAGVADPGDVPLWVPALGVLLAALVWSATFRPRVWVEPGTLVLRNMLETVRLPLAAVEEVAVRQVMAVRAGGKRYVASGTGRTLRQALRGSAVQRAREEMGGLRAEPAQVVEPGMAYGDYIELRLRDLIAEDRTRRGLKKYSAELDELAEEVTREPAWPEIVLLVVAVAFFVFAVVF